LRNGFKREEALHIVISFQEILFLQGGQGEGDEGEQ
jgi:hypothetical protein